MEQWADESIGLNARKGLIGTIGSNQAFRTALLPNSVPDVFKNLVGAIPHELFGFLGMGVGMGPEAVKDAQAALKRDLTALCFHFNGATLSVRRYANAGRFCCGGLDHVCQIPDRAPI